MLKWVHVCAHVISTLCASRKCSCKSAQMRRLVWANTDIHMKTVQISHKMAHCSWATFSMENKHLAAFADLSLFALAHQTSGQFHTCVLSICNVERRLWRDCAYMHPAGQWLCWMPINKYLICSRLFIHGRQWTGWTSQRICTDLTESPL